LLFAAPAAGFVTFVKSNAKALLTAGHQKVHALSEGVRCLRPALLQREQGFAKGNVMQEMQ